MILPSTEADCPQLIGTSKFDYLFIYYFIFSHWSSNIQFFIEVYLPYNVILVPDV